MTKKELIATIDSHIRSYQKKVDEFKKNLVEDSIARTIEWDVVSGLEAEFTIKKLRKIKLAIECGNYELLEVVTASYNSAINFFKRKSFRPNSTSAGSNLVSMCEGKAEANILDFTEMVIKNLKTESNEV